MSLLIVASCSVSTVILSNLKIDAVGLFTNHRLRCWKGQQLPEIRAKKDAA